MAWHEKTSVNLEVFSCLMVPAMPVVIVPAVVVMPVVIEVHVEIVIVPAMPVVIVPAVVVMPTVIGTVSASTSSALVTKGKYPIPYREKQDSDDVREEHLVHEEQYSEEHDRLHVRGYLGEDFARHELVVCLRLLDRSESGFHSEYIGFGNKADEDGKKEGPYETGHNGLFDDPDPLGPRFGESHASGYRSQDEENENQVRAGSDEELGKSGREYLRGFRSLVCGREQYRQHQVDGESDDEAKIRLVSLLEPESEKADPEHQRSCQNVHVDRRDAQGRGCGLDNFVHLAMRLELRVPH